MFCGAPWRSLFVLTLCSVSVSAARQDFLSTKKFERHGYQPKGGKCDDDWDCNHPNGKCVDSFIGVQGACRCDRAWGGAHCQERQFFPAAEAESKRKAEVHAAIQAEEDLKRDPYAEYMKMHEAKNKQLRKKALEKKYKRTPHDRGQGSYCHVDDDCQQHGHCQKGWCMCPSGYSGPWCNDKEDSKWTFHDTVRAGKKYRRRHARRHSSGSSVASLQQKLKLLQLRARLRQIVAQSDSTLHGVG